MKSVSRNQLAVLVGLILLSAAMRVLPHPANFSPVMAMALFAGAFLGRGRMLAWFVPLLAMSLSDLVLGYSPMPFVYLAMALGVGIGQILAPRFSQKDSQNKKVSSLFGLTTAAVVVTSLMFFLISNFGVWFEGQLYPLNFQGLVACYTAAIPFLLKSLAGDLSYTYILFAAWITLRQSVPALSEVQTHGR